MDSSTETKKVSEIFINLGADPKIALQMSRQLLKKADQRSNELGITKTEALNELLKVAVYGAQGMLKPEE
jgi:hypothetical protein